MMIDAIDAKMDWYGRYGLISWNQPSLQGNTLQDFWVDIVIVDVFEICFGGVVFEACGILAPGSILVAQGKEWYMMLSAHRAGKWYNLKVGKLMEIDLQSQNCSIPIDLSIPFHLAIGFSRLLNFSILRLLLLTFGLFSFLLCRSSTCRLFGTFQHFSTF